MEKLALGFVETRGLIGNIDATDIMPKTSELEIVKYVSIGGGYMNIIYQGDVGAVKSAINAVKSKQDFPGSITATNVIPRPHNYVVDLIKNYKEATINLYERGALGMIETVGYTPMIEAADAGVKAADVIASGWITIGSGYCTIFFRGDVAAVTAAVDAGVKSAEKVGKIVASHIIPRPHLEANLRLPIGKPADYTKKNKKEEDVIGKGEALGIVETKGFSALVEAVDTGLKRAEVSCTGWYKVGSALVSTIFRGAVAAVTASTQAAAENAKNVGELIGYYVIPRPHISVEEVVYKFSN
ncbi:MAG TPA: BMC domain-containing protein [bacterium]|nr:BMC domain-containing protein [bacterium]HOL48694.1 BMC domain-containing protein [bacterium]HPQ18097.1 BMC domain-containing protein [bacterium]